MRIFLAIFFAVGIVYIPIASQANPPATTPTAADDDSGTATGLDDDDAAFSQSGPANTGIGNGTSSGGSSGAGSGGVAQIACLSDSGAVLNADPSSVCKAVLPKCSVLQKAIIEKTKDMLSQKIWGYYNGKDVDLAKSSPNNLIGTDLPFPVCSVVGHQLKYSAGRNDIETKTQAIGKKGSCGERPRVIASRSGKKFALNYDNNAGSLWISYMLGAYPWLIRKHGADVLNTLKPDLSNINSLITNKAMIDDLVKTATQMKDYNQKLAAEVKTTCNTGDSDLTAKCMAGTISVTDPAQRVCTIVKAQLAANEGAVPNILAYEVMQRVQKQYDDVFAKLINFKNPTMSGFSNECGDTGSFGRSRKKKISMTASCFFGGSYCTTNDGTVREDGPNVPGVCGEKNTRILIPSGRTTGGLIGFNSTAVTKNVGFAAVVEKLIRHDVCGQNSPGDDSICDKINIPSKPANAP
ncbi:MAG: hypothetical protein JST80_00945 [Bdellovibrionales bacterium]|nr:hypothetical protein [Bdellovibrionales bacterium]